MYLARIPEILFKWIPLILVGCWVCQALYSVYAFGPFSHFRMFGLDIMSDFFNVGSGTLHASTALIGYSFFLLSFMVLRETPLPHRTVIAFTLPVFGLLFYDLVHAIADFFITARGQPLIQAVLVSVCFLILHFYNKNYNFLQRNIFFIPMWFIFILSFLLLIASGFFQNLYFYDTSYGPNPHNEFWLVTKFTAVWLWVGVLKLE